MVYSIETEITSLIHLLLAQKIIFEGITTHSEKMEIIWLILIFNKGVPLENAKI